MRSQVVDSSSPEDKEAREADVEDITGENMLSLIWLERQRGVGMESFKGVSGSAPHEQKETHEIRGRWGPGEERYPCFDDSHKLHHVGCGGSSGMLSTLVGGVPRRKFLGKDKRYMIATNDDDTCVLFVQGGSIGSGSRRPR